MLSGLFKGEQKQQPLVAIPLPNKNDLNAPVTPQVVQMFEAIEQHRAKTPAYIPFKPGTPTLAREQFEEGTRRWGTEFDEGKRRWEQEFALTQKQFEAQQEQRRIQNALAQQAAQQASSGVELPSTVGERKNYYYGAVLKKYQDEMNKLKQEKGRKDAWDTEGQYYWKLPSTEDIVRKLYDIEADMAEELPNLRRMGLTSRDINEIFRIQVIENLGTDGEQTYKEWKQQKGIKLDLPSMLSSDSVNDLLYGLFTTSE
jgi:hypothetical protein